MAKELINYRITTNPEFSENGEILSIKEIAITSDPAIITKGFAFNSHVKKHLVFKDELKYRIVAPILIPNLKIYRSEFNDKNELIDEYTVEFTVEEIENEFVQLCRDNSSRLFNVEHTDEKVDAFMLDRWIVGPDNKKDKAYSEFGIDVPSGTLMGIAQITNKEHYAELIANDRVGFSVEGVFALKLNKQEKMNELMLPDGEHTIGEKIYVIKDGAVLEIKDVVKEEAMAEDVKKEEESAVVEDAAEDIADDEIKKEEMAEDAPVNVADEIANATIDPIVYDEATILDIVQPKFDELISMIAELKAAMETDEVMEDKVESVGLTKAQKMYAAINALRA